MNQLYSDLKIFHFSGKLSDIVKSKLSAPLHIRLKPTNRCNHSCYYCCYRNKNLYLSQLVGENDQIPFNKMKEIVADLEQMKIKAVTISGGGEPLCYPYIQETVESLLNSGIKIGLLTNGSLLQGNISKILGKKATWVRISIDAADSKLYAKTRGVSIKEFDKVCNNIYNFSKVKNKDCELGISYIVTKENHKDIFKFLKLMKKIGVNHVKISEAVVSTVRERNKRHYLPIINTVKKQVDEAISSLNSSSFRVIDKFDYFIDKVTNDNYSKQYRFCPFIQYMTVIAADLNIYACQDKAYTLTGKLGSIKNGSFKGLWFSNGFKKRILGLNPSKECDHHCVQHNKNLMLLDYINANRSHLEFV